VLLRLPATPPTVPPGTAKITFTSGTTGAPKGVCLDLQAMRRVAAGLVQAMEFLDVRRHLCALPLAVLLENIAGVMAPLSRGAACIVPPLHEVGLSGSSAFDAVRFHAAVMRYRPDSVIVLPQMLRAWVEYLQHSGEPAPASLRIVAVGGAAVGERLICAARAHGIPAYEGFGLSEGASVQTLNLPGADRPGSAGRPLPHARVRIAADGEIEIAGTLMTGYLGDSSAPPAWWPTGDLGRIDSDGFLHVHGRKKHLLITAFGRNVSPEWVETALRSQPPVAHAVVFGDAQPALSAVIWPAAGELGDAELQAAVEAANAALPDYARVHRWAARAAFSPNGPGHGQWPSPARSHPAIACRRPGHPGRQSFLSNDPMSFYVELRNHTEAARQTLLAAPIIQGCLRGEVSLPSYLAFLREAYHHVPYGAAACAPARRPAERHRCRTMPLDEYVEEERGATRILTTFAPVAAMPRPCATAPRPAWRR
jgi:acyl-CoA synthetase (AMP-forming)/AMP-acid ligase II